MNEKFYIFKEYRLIIVTAKIERFKKDERKRIRRS